MLLFLPIYSFIVLMLFLKNYFSYVNFRLAFILSAIINSFLVTLFIELASLYSLIIPKYFIYFWSLLAIVYTLALFISDPRKLSSFFDNFELDTITLVLFAAILIVLFIQARVAFSFAPNTWDSMTYHLPRIMHWASNRNLDFYITDINRQLLSQPGAEYLLLNIFLLTKNDLFFNFLQLFCLVGCICSTTLIARLLGATIRGQMITGLFVITLPMAILQSTSTQNDLVVSFWVSSSILLLMLIRDKFLDLLFYCLSMALGLATITKGTSVIIFPFIFVYCLQSWRKVFKYIIIVLLFVFVIAAGHYIRSYFWLNGEALISSEQQNLMMKRHDPLSIGANFICNVASELMVPFDLINQKIEKGVNRILNLLSVDSKTVFDQKFARPPFASLAFDEDYASNPLHFILILIGVLILTVERNNKVLIYLICSLLSVILFIYLLKWQPFITRLHLPLFIIFAPLIGVVFKDNNKWLMLFVCSLLIVCCFLTIIFHNTRSLLDICSNRNQSREQSYFNKKPFDFNSYKMASKLVLSSGYKQVALIQGGDSWEYPLWALTSYGDIIFRKYVLLNEKDLPGLLIDLDGKSKEQITFLNAFYKLYWEKSSIRIYVLKNL